MAPQITHPTTPGFVPEPDRNPSDVEKDQINTNHEADDKKPDTEPSYKQEGVQRVEAITSVWTKQILIIMFVLYVVDTRPASHPFSSFANMSSQASTSSPSSTSSRAP